jgi:hypothetical protein
LFYFDCGRAWLDDHGGDALSLDDHVEAAVVVMIALSDNELVFFEPLFFESIC